MMWIVDVIWIDFMDAHVNDLIWIAYASTLISHAMHNDWVKYNTSYDDARLTHKISYTATSEDAKQENGQAATVAPDAALVKEMESLKKQVAETKEKMMYALAEADNTRRIAQRDVQNARSFAVEKFAKVSLGGTLHATNIYIKI